MAKIEELKQMAAEISLLKARVMKIGLIKTGHALEEAVTKVGWEIAEILENKHSYMKLEE